MELSVKQQRNGFSAWSEHPEDKVVVIAMSMYSTQERDAPRNWYNVADELYCHDSGLHDVGMRTK